MSTPRAIGLVLMAMGVSAYGTAPDSLALSVGLLGLAATLFADARYLRFAIARRNFRFLIDRAILLTGLALVTAIWLWRLIGSRPLRAQSLDEHVRDRSPGEINCNARVLLDPQARLSASRAESSD